MPTAKLHVRDMNEPADRKRVEQALGALTGVFGVVASCSAHCVEVDFEDDQIALDQLIEAVRKAGFNPSLAG